MALATRIAKTPGKAALNALVDSLDTGTGTASIKIMSGTQPAGGPDATFTGTTLASIDLNTPVFQAASTGTGNYLEADLSTNNTPSTCTSATATGTATWFRACNKSGVAKIDGSVGTTGTSYDMAIDNTSIVAAQTVRLNSWQVRLQYK